MRLMPASYNGFLFQQINRVASDFQTPYDWTIQGITTNDIPRSNNFPLRVAKNYTGAIKVINVNLLDVDITRDDLVMAMDVLGADQIQLIANDEFGRAWYVNADFIGLTEDTQSNKTASFGAVFAVDDPIWKKLIPSTASLTTDGSGTAQYLSITPIGNQPALPIITITPNGGGANVFGFTHQRFITIVNIATTNFYNYPIDITDGGLDTATLIAANKMLSNGDDCRVYINGVDVKRWFGDGGIDNASTTIWVNLTIPGSSVLINTTLVPAMTDAEVINEIQISPTTPAINAKYIPFSGLVLIDSEIFVYTAFNSSTLKLTGVTRAERQTTAGNHSAGASIYFIPDVWLYYGNPNIDPYLVDDTFKPIIDLTTSTNAVHVYSDFSAASGQRTAAWVKGTIFPSLDSHHYTATENTTADPASVAGMWCKEASLLYWWLFNPIGFEEITSLTGKKYSANGSFLCPLFQSQKGVLFDTVFLETTPAPLATWVALDTHTSETLTPGPASTVINFLRLMLYGYTGPAGVNENGVEMDALTLTLDSSYLPVISMATELSNFNVHSVITNTATGDSFTLDLSLDFDKYIVINTKEKTVTLYDGSNQINAILDFPIRAEWLQLLPQQANSIEIVEEGAVTYAFAWEDRSL